VRPAISALGGTLAVVLAVELASLVPVVGGLLAASLALAALGAAALTRLGLRPFTPAEQG
jgi:hypothetical protein